ncbi:hypothetical protein [Paraburkholderia sp. BR13444]|uniref:hypothetical protein n=1 Tax=Paraburkholderia sp. BR13444 TaxID=3236997 RepID=UPI0034CF74AA
MSREGERGMLDRSTQSPSRSRSAFNRSLTRRCTRQFATGFRQDRVTCGIRYERSNRSFVRDRHSHLPHELRVRQTIRRSARHRRAALHLPIYETICCNRHRVVTNLRIRRYFDTRMLGRTWALGQIMRGVQHDR